MTEPGDRAAGRRWLLSVSLAWSIGVLLTGVAILGAARALQPLYGLADPRVGPAGLGGFVTHAILCGSDLRRRRVLYVGIALECLRWVIVLTHGIPFDTALLSTGYGFLVASIADFVLRREWSNAGLTVLVPIGMANAQLGLSALVRKATPLTLDGALYAIDIAMRIPFSKWTGEMFERIPAITLLSLIAYAMLPGAIAAGLGYEEFNYRRGARRGVGVNLLLAYTVSGSIAALLYWICPGTGPVHAFPGAFPRNLPSLADVPLGMSAFAPLAPRNAMPSLHLAWAILLARSTAGARKSVRYGATVFAALTALATIGSGEHYVIDLVAAVPFLVALEAATAHQYVPFAKRIAPLVTGISLYLAWVLAARDAAATVPFLTARPAVTWLLVTATLIVSVVVALPMPAASSEQ